MADAPSTDRDEKLAAILSDLLQRHDNGEIIDINQTGLDYPELAAELRHLWAISQFASAVATTAPLEQVHLLDKPFQVTSFGDYELLEELGRGGMGVVYKARHKNLKRLVALKMMRDARHASTGDRSRFRAEAAASAKLQHPHIVRVYEVGENDGQPYFTMEYIAGVTLARRIAEHGAFHPREAAHLVAELASAIEHAHERGILHRDLKPANILIAEGSTTPGDTSVVHLPGEQSRTDVRSRQARAMVTDFGLAKRLFSGSGSFAEWRTHTGAIVGTPSYMAPEQATGSKELTRAADVYSLGAILYELLAGRPPFQAANPVDTLLMVIEQEPVPPRWLDPGIDRDLEMICLKCLQKPLHIRYATAAELLKDLQAFIQGEAVSTPPSGFRYFLSRMLRETHHAGVLENWGLLWIWHSLATFILCSLTQALDWYGVKQHSTYLILWSVGLITWGTILWQLRRRAGPVLFVERQIAHAWAAGVCAAIGMFVIEVLIDLPVLTLSPAIAIAAGMIFVFKAGILSGKFYLTAAMMFITASVMPLVPQASILIFGLTSALSFFLPGLKYYRLRRQAVREEMLKTASN